MSEPNPEANAISTPSALEKLRAMMREPPRTSADFTATSWRKPSPPTFRAIAPAASSEDPTQAVNLTNLANASKSRKRKASNEAVEGPVAKKKRGPKPKTDAATLAVVKAKGKKGKNIPQLPAEVWVRIAEFCAPKDFEKLCRVSFTIKKALLHWQTQVRQVQILEYFPLGMPKKFANLSQLQYTDLLGSGKGCMTPGCGDTKAEKTYWPFARRWCAPCYKEKTVKCKLICRNHVQTHTGFDHGWLNIHLLLDCIPHGVVDSYNKAHRTIIGDIPRHRTPKLHKVCEIDAIEELIQQWTEFMPKPYQHNPKVTNAENAAAALADKQWRDKRNDERMVYFQGLAEKNKKYMEDVVKIEECIAESKKAAQAEAAATRAKRKALLLEKAAEEFPDTPSDIILKLRCCKNFLSITKGFEKSSTTDGSDDDDHKRKWGILKPKIVSALLENANGSSRSSSVTPAPTSSLSTPSSTPAPSVSTPSGYGEISNDNRRMDYTPSSTSLSSAYNSRPSTPSMPMSSYGPIQRRSLSSSAEVSRPSTPSMSTIPHNYAQRQSLPLSTETSRPATPYLPPTSHGLPASPYVLSMGSHHGLSPISNPYAAEEPMRQHQFYQDYDYGTRMASVGTAISNGADGMASTSNAQHLRRQHMQQQLACQSSFQIAGERSSRQFPTLPPLQMQSSLSLGQGNHSQHPPNAD